MAKISEETILKIKELHDEGKSNLKIAAELSISNSTVAKYLKERYNIKGRKFVKQIDQVEFEKLWADRKSDKEIADYFGVKEVTIKTYRTRGENAGKFNQTRYFSQEEHSLSLLQEQMILGSLLGDTNLSNPAINRHTNSRLAIVHSEKQEELFMKKVEVLGEFMGSYKLYEPEPDKRTGKVYKTWRGNSKTHKVFTDIYKLLYPNGNKVITKEYLNKINHPIALAYWLMDDGTERGTIATHCFSKEENDLIVKWMLEKWAIKCSLQRELGYLKLYILQESRLNFERLIFPYIIPSMYYKLQFLDILQALSV